MIRSVMIYRILPLLALAASIPVHGESPSVAVAGYETGKSFVQNILPAAGFVGIDKTGQDFPVDSYREFAAVLWYEQLKDPTLLSATTLWDSAAEVQAVADYVNGGGRVVVTSEAVPVPTAQVRRLGAASDLIGITGVQKGAILENVKITKPEDPIFTGLEIPADGFAWGGGYSRAARGVTEAEVLATATTEGGEVLPFITVRELGSGRVYWMGGVPKRMEQTGVPAGAIAAYNTVLLRALGYTGNVLSSVEQSASPLAATGPSGWGLKPLGIERPMPEAAAKAKPAPVSPQRARETVEGPSLPISEGGKARAAIMVGDNASEAVIDAADLMSRELGAVTGAKFPIRKESEAILKEDGSLQIPARPEIATVLIVGPTRLGATLGIDPAKMPEEGFQIQPHANALHIVGRDANSRGVETYGTKFGVLDFLENQAGIRWLWPGESGTVRPQSPDLSTSRIRVRDAPSLAIRKLRNLGGSGAAYHAENLRDARRDAQKSTPRDQLSGFSRRLADGIDFLGIPYEDFARIHATAFPWFETARLGSHLKVNAGHAFHGWYEKYHKQHPDWFALQADGTRNQIPVRETFCTSNEGFRDAAARQVLEMMAVDPTLDGWSASLNDGGQNTFCMDEACRAQDPPNGAPISFRYELGGKDFSAPYVSMTDRILDYYNGVAERVTREKPDALVGAQAYSYYRLPPLQTPVHPSLVISFVGFSYLDHARHFTDMESWDQWSSLANRLILRPNTLHGGHGYPAVFINRMASDLRHCYATGMMGADFDSISHHWATQGLNYYVLARLLWNPDADPQEILSDYCRTGFGAGAPAMEAYFRKIEELTETVASNVKKAVESALRDEEDLNVARFALAKQLEEMNRIYSPPVENELRALLADATKAAEGDPGSLERIHFISRGLDYLAAQRTFYAAVDQDRGREALDARNVVFTDLFREDYFAVNLPVVLWRETALLSKLSPKPSQP